MSRLKLFLTLAVAGLLAFSGASQSVAAPTSLTVNGAVYTMGYTLLAPNHYKLNLHINLSGYTGGGSYLGSLAFNIGKYTSFSLLSTPDGLGNWTSNRKHLRIGSAVPQIRLTSYSADIMIEQVR